MCVRKPGTCNMCAYKSSLVRSRAPGFFADVPPEELHKYVIPPLPEDNDAAPVPRQGTTEGRQIRGRSHSSGGRVPHGESGELHPEGALEAENPANLGRDREERKCFGPIGAARDKCGSKPQHQQPQHQQPQHQQPQHQQPQHQQPPLLECAFCRRLGETRSFARTHILRDPLTNAVVCPILRKHRCEICGATGDDSHTRSYCPMKPEGTHNMALLKSTPRNSTGKRKR